MWSEPDRLLGSKTLNSNAAFVWAHNLQSIEGFCWVTEPERSAKCYIKVAFYFFALYQILSSSHCCTTLFEDDQMHLAQRINKWFLLRFRSCRASFEPVICVCEQAASTNICRNTASSLQASTHAASGSAACPVGHTAFSCYPRGLPPPLWTWLTSPFRLPKTKPARGELRGNSVTGSRVADPWEW